MNTRNQTPNPIHAQRKEDLDNLQKILDYNIPDSVRRAFEDMLMQLATERPWEPGEQLRAFKRYVRYVLSDGQREWVLRELKRHGEPEKGWISTGSTPRGREVQMAPVLRAPLPKRPPGR